MFDKIPALEKHILDGVAVIAMIGSLTEFLPHVAAIMTITWTGIRIYETETVQFLIGKRPIKLDDD